MGWVRTEDTYLTHPKVLHVGRDARVFWDAARCWSSANLTDGYIPESAYKVIATNAGVGSPRKLAAALLTHPAQYEHGLAEEAEGGFLIHDYLHYNPSSADVQAKKAAKAAAGKLGGQHSGDTRRSKPEANPKQNPKQKRTPVPIPVPVPHTAVTTSVDQPKETDTEDVGALAVAPAARSLVRAVPKADQGVPKPHRAMIAALGAALGEPRTKGDWAKYATAAADLVKAGADPEDIGDLVGRWDELFAGATCTPFALSNNYAALTGPRRATANGHRATTTRPPGYDALAAAYPELDPRRQVLEAG